MFRLLRIPLALLVILTIANAEPVEARGRVKCPAVRTLCLPPLAPTFSTVSKCASVEKSRSVQITKTECDGVTCKQVTRSVTRSTAQTRAEKLAQIDPGTGLQAGHHAQLGPVGGYEGLGFGPTPEAATQRSCFWGQRPVREIGTAQGNRGWYAVVLYD